MTKARVRIYLIPVLNSPSSIAFHNLKSTPPCARRWPGLPPTLRITKMDVRSISAAANRIVEAVVKSVAFSNLTVVPLLRSKLPPPPKAFLVFRRTGRRRSALVIGADVSVEHLNHRFVLHFPLCLPRRCVRTSLPFGPRAHDNAESFSGVAACALSGGERPARLDRVARGPPTIRTASSLVHHRTGTPCCDAVQTHQRGSHLQCMRTASDLQPDCSPSTPYFFPYCVFGSGVPGISGTRPAPPFNASDT